MRPVRVEMEGFSAFRSPTVVDFTDADLFAFVGPTGAGKSSVIDAMIFSLYGSVPRYGSDRLVHPVITQGKPEARVRFDFEIGGVDHTAVRVVRRTKTGATTKEARLQRGDEILASDARGVTEAAVELLGLDLEQFTKCVVLPQGAFAALLHDTAGNRQNLLVKLLDFGIYERVASAARQKMSEAQQRLAVLDAQLEDLAGATPEAIETAGARVESARMLVQELDSASGQIGDAETAAETAAAEVALVSSRIDLVDAVRIPDGLVDVADALKNAADAVEVADRNERESRAAVEIREAERAELGDMVELERLLSAHENVSTLRTRVDAGRSKIAEHEVELAALREAAEKAGEVARAAVDRYERARLEDAAADLARHVHEGDDCPVCGSVVSSLPVLDDEALAAAEALHRGSLAEAESAKDALRAAEASAAGYDDQLQRLLEELTVVETAVDGAPPPEALREQVTQIAEADNALAEARRVDSDAREAVAVARKRLAELSGSERRLRAEYGRARDSVSELGPPGATDDIESDWLTLFSWCQDQVAELADRSAVVAKVAADAGAKVKELRSRLVERAAQAGVTVPTAPTVDLARIRDAAVSAEAREEAERVRLVEQRDRADGLRSQRAEIAEVRSVHEMLVGELHPKRFEAWLLEEALASLVDGASSRLEQLSSGRYALALDDKQAFEVIDHSNADERRLARTLSGGETFLASLALALALAERVSELSPGRRAQLDAIFLDEGFGTLDPETLDVVASAIEELGASGRMVGIVSHVRELAERVPTRFEVRRGPDTSTVERVDA